MIAHDDEGRVVQQSGHSQIGQEIAVRVVAQLRIVEEIVSQTGLPEEREVSIVDEFGGDLASVVE